MLRLTEAMELSVLRTPETPLANSEDVVNILMAAVVVRLDPGLQPPVLLPVPNGNLWDNLC